ncbi:DALR anticodon-binding domain-containing protein [Capilliphycus salinus ALCB114379]|uniref:DALR anticodon-binding domain-containing protein n=1 Tax=Capilliphycus salinus TaxID=2768948 RepID=UPI0039A7644F
MVQCFLVNKLYQHIRCQEINIDSQDIPVYLLKESWPIRYHSAIALKLAKIKHQNPIDIAAEIVQGLSFQSDRVEITVEVISNGIIAFELSDRTVASWLQQIIKTPLPESSFPRFSNSISADNHYSKNRFGVQYSHARCCSILRLADRDRIITLDRPNPQRTPALWFFIEPDPIPWLDVSGKLRIHHPSEQQLIGQLLNSLDADSTSSDQQFWEKRADQISNAFQAFYSQCRIWGEVKLQTPKIAQVRLGLISITQAILRYILQEKLGVLAPLEL